MDEEKSKRSTQKIIPEPNVPNIRFPAKIFSNDPAQPVSITALVTEADRLRLKTIANAEDITLQVLTHRVWNIFLESRGYSKLTPISRRKPKSDGREG